MRDFWETVGAPAAIVAVLISLVASIVMTGVYYADKRDCRLIAQQAGVVTKFESAPPLQWDCYVQVNDGWIPLDRWRGVEN